MKTFALVLALSLVVPGAALAINPSLSAGGGGMNVVDSGRSVCWSQPANLGGLIASSEIIGHFGIETELANDFFLTNGGSICLARWWGGYFNNYSCDDIGFGTYWILRFYDDAFSVPGVFLYEAMVLADEHFCYCQGGLYPIFKYEADISFGAVANTLYWFGAVAADHAFPPQVGRVATCGILGCETVFKSAYFSYPEWTPASVVFGVEYEASQEFDCTRCAVPIEKTTWGAVKRLYR